MEGSLLLALPNLNNLPNESFSKCRSELNRLEMLMKQSNGIKRVKPAMTLETEDSGVRDSLECLEELTSTFKRTLMAGEKYVTFVSCSYVVTDCARIRKS